MRTSMYLLDLDLDCKFKCYLLGEPKDFIFNGNSKKSLRKFMAMYHSDVLTARQKYKKPVEVKNVHNWYIDADAIMRLGIDLKLGEEIDNAA